MKITDEQLLDAIWENQLRILPKGVLNNYIGGSVNVCCDERNWHVYSSEEHRMSMERITNKIGRKQLISRIRSLIKNGSLYCSMSDYKGLFTTFMIDNKKALEAFKAARQFWLDKGVPTGYYKTEGRTGSITTKDVDVDSIVPECQRFLKIKFGKRSV